MEYTERFKEIYNKNLWGNEESLSGNGSTIVNTLTMRGRLNSLLRRRGITSISDIGCGDWNWMREMDLEGINYIGFDIVEECIEENRKKYNGIDFRVVDAITTPLPKVDLIFCRDVMGHLTNQNTLKMLENFRRSGSRWLLATTFTRYSKNVEGEDGGWKAINLMIEPFFLKVEELINEECPQSYPNYNDKCLILHRLND